MALDRPGTGFEPLVVGALASLNGVESHVGIEANASVTLAEKSGDFVARIGQYLDAVVEWNARTNLTGARTAEELVDLAVADGSIVARYTTQGSPASWCDVGSGMGSPAVGLALLRPDDQVTLVEPREKRVAFLRSVVGGLGMDRAYVQRARSDDLDAESFDAAFSRATLPPGEWLVEGARLARNEVWVLLARGEPPAQRGWSVARDVRYQWPLTEASRRAVCFVRGRP